MEFEEVPTQPTLAPSDITLTCVFSCLQKQHEDRCHLWPLLQDRNRDAIRGRTCRVLLSLPLGVHRCVCVLPKSVNCKWNYHFIISVRVIKLVSFLHGCAQLSPDAPGAESSWLMEQKSFRLKDKTQPLWLECIRFIWVHFGFICTVLTHNSNSRLEAVTPFSEML